MLKIVLAVLIVSASLVSLAFALDEGLQRQAVVDCYTAQEYEATYPMYEPSATTTKNCQIVGVDVFAHVD